MMTKSDIKYFLNEDVGNIFDNGYVTEVLGIKPKLNEVYGISKKRDILQEQLLLEGWWDDLKKLPGELKGIFTALKKTITDPNYVQKWVSSINGGIINKYKNKIVKFLQSIIDSPENKLNKLAKTILDKLKGYFDNIYSMSGWKLAIGVTGLGLAIQWLWDKFGKMILSGIGSLGIDAVKTLLGELNN